MKKILSLIMGGVLVTGMCLFIYSCAKKNNEIIVRPGTDAVLTTVPDDLLKAAKDWHAGQLKAPTTLSINTVTSKGKLGANWKETELQTLPDGQQLVVVQSPLIKLGANSPAGVVRKFVFGTSGGAITNGRIIEIYGTAEYMASHKGSILENYNLNKLTDFSGSVIEYDVNYNYIKSVVYKEGKMMPGSMSKILKGRPGISSSGKVSTNALTTMQSCYDVWDVYYDHHDYCNCWVETYRVWLYNFCSDDDNEAGGDPPYGGGNPPGNPGGSSGPSGNDFDNAVAEGEKPTGEYADACTGVDAMRDASLPTPTTGPRETTGLLTKDGKVIIIGTYNETSATIPGLKTYNGQLYYGYPNDAGAPSQTYQDIIINPSGYFIPIKSTMHTHTICEVDGSNGVHDSVSIDDMKLANKFPPLSHYAIGCDAVGQFIPHAELDDTDVPYHHTWVGPLSGTTASTCGNIK